MNEFREWLSDNLRYIMLGVGILLGLVVIFFGIRFMTSSMNLTPNNNQVEASVTPTPTPTATTTPTATATPTPTPVATEELVENGIPEVTALVTKYFNAWAKKDITALREMVNVLTVQDEAVIMSDTTSSYSDFRVYTRMTNITGTYVAFVYYKYQLSGITTPVPSLTQVSVCTNNEGELYINTTTPTPELQSSIDSAIASQAVQDLINQVQKEYDAALSSDPALYAYFNPS